MNDKEKYGAFGRVCVFCEHYGLDFGCPDYSEYTPGEPVSAMCSKDHFYLSELELRRNPKSLENALLKGISCPDFEDGEYIRKTTGEHA